MPQKAEALNLLSGRRRLLVPPGKQLQKDSLFEVKRKLKWGEATEQLGKKEGKEVEMEARI